MTNKELFKLGIAYGSFSCGDIDQGIHIVLPGTIHEGGRIINEVFRSLFEKHLNKIPSNIPENVHENVMYMRAVINFLKENEPRINLEEFI